MSALSGPVAGDGGETGTGARRDETERYRATEGADTTGGELRKDIAKAVAIETDEEGWTTFDVADAVLALPALRDLLAERDTLAAQVQAVEAAIDRHADNLSPTQRAAFRRALGTPTTGGGE